MKKNVFLICTLFALLCYLTLSNDIWSVLRGGFGFLVFIGIAWLFSENKKKVNWQFVLSGVLLQIAVGLLVLRVEAFGYFFQKASSVFVKIISFSRHGSNFLFASFSSGQIESPLVNFAFVILPTILFFSAFSSVLYYFGILQKIVYVMAWGMKKLLRLSGSEALSVAGNIFLGQTEAPLLVKPYLPQMTRSELMTLMTGGMATIAGGVMAAYVNYLGGDDPVAQAKFAKHLLAASFMNAPAAIFISKILVPQQETISEDMHVSHEKIGGNLLESIANGTSDGLKLAVNVGAMLLVFTALMAFLNEFVLMGFIGKYTGLNALVAAHTHYNSFSLEFILGYVFAPLSYLMGVASEDIFLVGQLLGKKTIINEFVAYMDLSKMIPQFKSEKSLIISTYALCGFSNFASIGIQIGGMSTLAPGKRLTLSQLGFKALLGASLACLSTGLLAGMLI